MEIQGKANEVERRDGLAEHHLMEETAVHK